MEGALRAIANPHRRAMLELVWDRERTAGEIARRSGLSAPAASQHLRVLRDAGLVSVRADANRRLYRADQARMAELRAALEDFWGTRLGRLRDAAEGSGAVDERGRAAAQGVAARHRRSRGSARSAHTDQERET
jgi:DNA-binding transcriptional ArsR family regulator